MGKIPKKINILGFDYEVILEETEQMKRNSWIGCINSFEKKIWLDPDIPHKQQLQTLLHEIIHGIDWIMSGKGGYELTEQQTDQLASGILSVLLNNKVDIWN